MDNISFFALALILIIQLYKVFRPALGKLGISPRFLNGVDAALEFVYDVVPGLYRSVEALAKKGKIKPGNKWKEFLRLLNEQAGQEGVVLTDRERARAELIVKDLAARDHQPSLRDSLAVNPTSAPEKEKTEASQ